MSFSTGIKKEKSSSESKPLSVKERQEYFDAAMGNIGGIPTTGYKAPSYTGATFTGAGPIRSATYTDPGEARTLTGGDYDRLEKNILASFTTPLERQRTLDQRDMDQAMAERGIYTSLNAIRGNSDLAERYAPVLAKAAADAATQRYGLQSNELNALNGFALNRAGQANQFNLGNTQMLNEGDLARANSANEFNVGQAAARNGFSLNLADRQYDDAWRKPEFLAGMWNGTAGQKSASGGRGWGFDISGGGGGGGTPKLGV